MSAMEADEQDRGTVLHYAPRHVRYPAEERSIRPILERLRRGESDTPSDAPVDPALQAPFPLDPPRKMIGWQLIACSVLSAALSAGFAVLAIGWLAPMKSESLRIDSAQLDPKIVRTVSFQEPAADGAGVASAKQDVKPEAAPTPGAAEPAPAAKTEPRRDQVAPKELLAMWSGIPSEARTETAIAPPTVSSGPEVQGAKTEAETPPAPRSEHREAAPRRIAHARRHSDRNASAARRSRAANAQAAAAAQTSESNSLQSALQSVFGGQPAAKPQGARQQEGGASAPPQPQNY